MSELLNMYKMIPKYLLMQKKELNFIVSRDIYEREKKYIFNGKFLGIKVKTHDIVPNNYASLGRTKLKDIIYGRKRR